MNTEQSFQKQYGTWAIICGASDGVGERFALELAKRGLNLILVSRRQQVLEAIANRIKEETGVKTKALGLDLSHPDAVSTIISAAEGLEVGMLVYCAGADPHIGAFRDRSLKSMTDLVQRNCLVSLSLCHHFAPLMQDRGQGGIILLSSGAGFQGIANLVAYCASKAFDMVMGEALWAELRDSGVDVLSLVLTTTDTPAFRRTLVEQGVISDVSEIPPIATLVSPEQVVEEALDNLQNGPTWFVSEAFRAQEKQLRALSRNDAVKAIAGQAKSLGD